MKKFKLLMGFLSPLIVIIVAVVCVGGIFAAMQQRISMQNDFLYEKHIGSGTEEDPYLIYSLGVLDAEGHADLGSFNYYAGANEQGINYFTSKNSVDDSKFNYFRQVQDILPEAKEEVVKTGLNGYYNAYNRNITVNNMLFESIGKGNKNAYIKNLNVLTNGVLNQTAGLVQDLYGTIENVVFSGSIENTSNYISYGTGNLLLAGGLVARAHSGATILECRNLGLVSAQHLAGGLVGAVQKDNDAPVSINYSYNKGTVRTTANATGCYVGGLVGSNSAVLHINDSYNSGVLESLTTNTVGGMVGSNKSSVSINRTYSLMSGSGSKALVADGSVNSQSDNTGFNFTENSGTILGAYNENATLNSIQNVNSYANWNFAEKAENGEVVLGNNWVMAFGTVSLGSSGKVVNLFLPHLWYEVENLSGEFNLSYVAGDKTTGETPQTKSYSKKDATIQIEKNINNLAKYGYKFLGWATYENADAPLFKLDAEGKKMPMLTNVYSLLEEVSLYPVWEVRNYSLFFYNNGGTWNSIPEGFGNQGDGILKFEYTIEDDIVFPMDISREGFVLEGFEITNISENGVAITNLAGVEQEAFMGSVCNNFAEGTHGDIVLKAKWQGQTGIKYQVIYELANKAGNFNDANGTVERYIFETTGVAGSIFSNDNQGLVSLDAKDLKVYNPSKTFAEMEDVEDTSIISKIKAHFSNIREITTNSSENIIEGDNSTIAIVKMDRNQYSIALTAAENIYEIKAVSALGQTHGKYIEFQLYYDTELSIVAELESGYIFNYWKDENGEIFGEEASLQIASVDKSLNLFASAIGGYTLKIYPNHSYAKLSQEKFDEFMASVEAYDTVNYLVSADGIITITNRRLGVEQPIPASFGIGNNALYEIPEIINGPVLVGFSQDKNADAMSGILYNDTLEKVSFSPSNVSNDEVINLYAIWTKPIGTVTLNLNDADLTHEATKVEVQGVIPNTFKNILGDGIGTLGYNLRDGYELSHWEKVNPETGKGDGEAISTEILEQTIILEDVEYIAIWKGGSVNYTLVYKTQTIDGQGFENISIQPGTTIAGASVSTQNLCGSSYPGFVLTKITYSDSVVSEEIVLKDVNADFDIERFEHLGNADQVISIYYDRLTYQVTLENTDVGIEAVQYMGLPDDLNAIGIVEKTGNVVKARFGTELTVNATLKEGYSWNVWLDGDRNEVSSSNIYSFVVQEDLTLYPTTGFKYRLALQNDGAIKDGQNYITKDMCKTVGELPSGVETVIGQDYLYILTGSFNTGEAYGASSYLKFSLFELRSEYDNCQYQIGWADEAGNVLITWDKNGIIQTNSSFSFVPSEANEVIVLHAIWSEEKYSLDVDYDSEQNINNSIEKLAPFKATRSDIVETPEKKGYKFDGYKIEQYDGLKWVEVEVLDIYDFVITKNTKVTALWTTSGTETLSIIRFDIMQTDGEYNFVYLSYVGESLDFSKAKLLQANAFVKLPTETEIKLEDLKDWILKNRNIFPSGSENNYTHNYIEIVGGVETKINGNTVNVKADGTLYVVIRFDLKTAKVFLNSAEHVEKIGFDRNYIENAKSFYMGAKAFLYAEASDGYEIVGWEYSYSANNVSYKLDARKDEGRQAYYFEVPSGTKEIYATPIVRAIDYEISLSETNLDNATTVDDKDVNIGNVLNNGENIYTIENDEQINLANLKKVGYKFIGYKAEFESGKVFTNVSGTKQEIRSGDIISNIAPGSFANITLTAQFVANTYVITFNANRGDIDAGTEIIVPAETKTVTFDEENIDLGVATISDIKYGFKGWSLDYVDWSQGAPNCISNANGICEKWSVHRDDWTKTESAGGDTYSLTLYAVWVEFPKHITIIGDTDKIQSLTVSTVVGESNAKWFRNASNSTYEIYLNEGYVVKLELEMVPGYKVKDNGTESWIAEAGTNWTWSAVCRENPPFEHTSKNFELDITNWIGGDSDQAKIRFVAEEVQYTLSYNLNYSYVGVTEPSITGSVETKVKFGQNVYETLGSYLTRTLTPDEIAFHLESYTDSSQTKNLVPRGYKFDGWYRTKDCLRGDEVMYFDGTDWSCINWTTAGNATLYAKWVEQEFAVMLYNNYSAEDTSVFGTGKVAYNAEVDDWSVPSREGYSFVGWFKDSEGTTALTNQNGKSIGAYWTWLDDLTAYAKWEAESYKLYAVKANAHNPLLQQNVDNLSSKINAEVSDYPEEDILVTYDLEYVIDIKPVRTGYTFLGWFVLNGNDEFVQITDAEGKANSNVWVVDLGENNARIEMFAKWEQSNVNVTIKHSYEKLDGTFEQTASNRYSVLADNYINETILSEILAEEKEGFYNEIGEEQIEFKFFRNSVELIDEESKIAYADGTLEINICYYRLRLDLHLVVDSTERIENLAYEIAEGLIEEEFEASKSKKHAIVRFGTSVKLILTLKADAEFVEWIDVVTGYANNEISADNELVLTESLALQAVTRWTEYNIVYRDCETLNAIYSHASLPYSFPEASRLGFKFLGYQFDICLEDHEHSTCEKYYDVQNSNNIFKAKICINGKIEEVNLSYGTDSNGNIAGIKTSSRGTVVLRALWQGLTGTQFKVVIHEQGTDGVYGELPSKFLFTTAGTEIKMADRESITAYDNNKHAGNPYFVFNLQNAWADEPWVEAYYMFAEYIDYSGVQYFLSDILANETNPTAEELESAKSSVSVLGNGSLVLHIYKQRKVVLIDLNIQDEIAGAGINPFESIILSAGNFNKVVASWSIATDGGTFTNHKDLVFGSESNQINFINGGVCIGSDIFFKVFYGGSYILTINALDGYNYNIVFSDGTFEINLADKHVVKDNVHTIYDVTGIYNEINIIPECIEYTIRFNLNDLSYSEEFGSTSATCQAVSGVTFVQDENGNYVELKISAISNEMVLANKLGLSRDGYNLAGFKVKEIASTTGNLKGRLKQNGTAQDLVSGMTDYVYSIMPGAYGDENSAIAIFDVDWTAKTYSVRASIGSVTQVSSKFTFDTAYKINDAAEIFKGSQSLLSAHKEKLANNKKFLGWFSVSQTTAFNNTTFAELVDKENLTQDEMNAILEKYLFGLRTINGTNYNIEWNLKEYGAWRAEQEVCALEQYLIDNANKYINNINSATELDGLKNMYAWYIDASFRVDFDLNLSSIISGATTELASFAGDESNPKLLTKSLKWKPSNISSQVIPAVNTLDNWGRVCAWSLNPDGKPGDEGYFEISATDTYINEAIESSLVRQKTLYAIYEGKELSISYDLNLGRETTANQIYTETGTTLFNPSFKISVGSSEYDLTHNNIKSILGSEAIIGGISMDHYILSGFKMVVEEGSTAGVTSSTNEAFILASDIGKVKTAAEWKAKYMLSGNVTFEAVWVLNAIKVVYHANYASDVDLEALNLKEADIVKYIPYALGTSFEILKFDASALNFTSAQSGMFVGWATSHNATVPNTDTYSVGTTLSYETAREIVLYAIWKGSIDNPFEISNACEFNYLSNVDCGGENIPYRAYLESFDAFGSTTKFYFDFTNDIHETSSTCGSASCSYIKMEIPTVNNAIIKGFNDQNDNASFDDGESIKISKNGTELFDKVIESEINGFDFEIETYTISNGGLLAKTIEYSKIKNISVSDNINPSGNPLTIKGEAISGEVANSELKNIVNNVDLQSSYYGFIGGMFNQIDNSKLENIINNGDCLFSSTSASTIAFRLILGDDSSAKNIINNGKIAGAKYIGGLFAIVSKQSTKDITLSGLHNWGELQIAIGGSGSGFNGGLILSIESSSTGEIYITNSSNTGDIITEKEQKASSLIVGGLIGQVEDVTVKILESYNTGSIIDNSYSESYAEVSLLGGFVGYAKSNVEIENSYVTSKIVGETGKDGISYASGFVGFGENASVKVTNSYSMASLEGKFNSGIAAVNLGTLTTSNSYFIGSGVADNYLEKTASGKERADMQKVGTYSGWNFISIDTLVTRTDEVWLQQNSSSLLNTKMRVGGYYGLYKLPRLWWEELPKSSANFNIVYNKNDDSATLINYDGSTGAYTLLPAGAITVPNHITYDNATGQIKDTNSYASGSAIVTTLGGVGYQIQDNAATGRKETTFAWWAKTGYDFLGFSLDPNATSREYLVEAQLSNVYYSGELTLYAIWSPMSYSITYLNTKGVENSNATSYIVGEEVILKDLPNATGYEFSHWVNSAGVKQDKVTAGTSGDLKFTAVWTPITYEVVIDLNSDFDEQVDNAGDIKTSTYTIENVSALNDILKITSTSEINSKFLTSLNVNLYRFKHFKVVSISSVGSQAKILNLDSEQVEVGDIIGGIATGSYGEFKIIAVYEGDKSIPFEIPDVETFNEFAYGGYFASGNNYHFIQTNNINVSAADTLAVVDLNGVYNAQGYTLTFENGKTQSLFKTIGSKGAIKNLNIDFKTSSFVADQAYDGLVADMLYGTIENISVAGDINVSGKVGYFGNIGFAYEGAKVSGFRNYANFNISRTIGNAAYIGGIIGNVMSVEGTSAGFALINSMNEGNITITGNADYVGGLVGQMLSDSVDNYIIKDCYNAGNITASATYVGGIVGVMQNASAAMENCYNTGTIVSGAIGNAAGLAGAKLGNSTISYSYSIGEIDTNCLVADAIFAVGTSTTSLDLFNYYLKNDNLKGNGGTGKTLQEFAIIGTYDASWNIQDEDAVHEEDSNWSYIWATDVIKLNGTLEYLTLPRLWWEEIG